MKCRARLPEITNINGFLGIVGLEERWHKIPLTGTSANRRFFPGSDSYPISVSIGKVFLYTCI